MFDDFQKQNSQLNNNLVQANDKDLIDDFEIFDAKNEVNNQSNLSGVVSQTIDPNKIKTEDIFSKTDSFEPSKNVLKPGGKSPKEPITNYKELIKEVDNVQSNKIRPHYFFIGFIVLILILGSTGFFIYKKFFTGANQTGEIILNKNGDINKENNINNEFNSNLIETQKDSDGDGLSDEEETKLGMNINSPDSDGDGLSDRDEVKIYHTDPLKQDTDNDSHIDGVEVKNGYNPNGPGKLLDFSLITGQEVENVLQNPNLDTSNWKDFSSISNIYFKYPSDWNVTKQDNKIILLSLDKKSKIEIDIRDNKLELDLVDWFLTQKDYPNFLQKQIKINQYSVVSVTSNDLNWKIKESIFVNQGDKVYNFYYYNSDNIDYLQKIFYTIILSFNIK